MSVALAQHDGRSDKFRCYREAHCIQRPGSRARRPITGSASRSHTERTADAGTNGNRGTNTRRSERDPAARMRRERNRRGLGYDWRRPALAGCDPLGKRASIIVLSWAYRGGCWPAQSSNRLPRAPRGR
ncbi:hypothetical protein EVAR_61353_1 [Eumeta japonica]|uniref:Uncharacterized protein n=1 Tax=Eumeta variegata TaxID=151549 RepID=A0A4C1ZUD8_EUMVA|nr:hypothetical protein EVAR_61353_1 [Eumeta japonica]